MHTAHVLRPADFALERAGRPEPLDALWPGYAAEEDRLAVVLADPLGAVACANLILATTALFYAHLRAVDGEDGFFRYPDTFLLGAGIEPGEYRRLDVWPPHKVLAVPAEGGPEALLEALTDRRVTLLAVPEAGLAWRGPAVRSTWNTLARLVRRVVAYGGREGDLTLAGNPTVEGYVEHAVEHSAGVSAQEREAVRERRRALDRAPLVPAEGLRVLGDLEAALPLLGVTEVLPAGQAIA